MPPKKLTRFYIYESPYHEYPGANHANACVFVMVLCMVCLCIQYYTAT